jgi:DNA-binding transcriptional ArsR family regulator
MARWTFLSNHGRALLCIAHDPEVRLSDIAANLNLTERSAYGIVNDLAEAGYILKEREGRRNRYEIQHHLPLPETPDRDQAIGDILSALTGDTPRPKASRRRARR